MKQRITIEQLKELEPEQAEKLRNWWQPNPYDHVAYTFPYDGLWQTDEVVIKGLYNNNPETIEEISDEEGEYLFPKSKCLPLLNIGQMLEYIHGQENNFLNTHNLKLYGHESTVLCSLEFIICHYPQYICDALFMEIWWSL